MNEAEPTTRLRLHVSTAVQGAVIPRDRHSAGDARLQGYGGFKSSRHHLSST